MAPAEERAEEARWWSQGWAWFLGGLALFLLLSLLLGWGNAAGALTAAFTGLVALYTRRLAELQREVNQVMGRQTEVLERQAELMDKQRELMREQAESAKRQGEILAQQEALMEEQTKLLEKQAESAARQSELQGKQAEILERQHALQESLARAEQTPLLSLAFGDLPNPGYEALNLVNAGKYGAIIVGLLNHSSHPDKEPSTPKPVPSGAAHLPWALPPGAVKEVARVRKGESFRSLGPFLECIYYYGAQPEKLLSDLWRIKGNRVFPVWRAREVPEDGDQEG